MASEEIRLISPDIEYADQITAYKNEFIKVGDSMSGCGNLSKCKTTKEWIDGLKLFSDSKTCPEGMVPSNTYLAVRQSDNKLVGIIDLRMNINNPVLKSWGGHIGYSVRPHERRKGYAKKMLSLILQNAKALGLERVMISCDNDNIASEKTIIANGGKFEKTVDVNGKPVKVYWITL